MKQPAPTTFPFRAGAARFTIGSAGSAYQRSPFGRRALCWARSSRRPTSGRWRVVADVSDYEAAANPDANVIDSNPYGVLAEPGRHIVTDAGGNSLLEVNANGDVITLAVFPARPGRSTDAVPTAVVVGPDGAYYVSELTGVPFADGAARVYRVVPGQAPEAAPYLVQDDHPLDFGPDGSLYVLQHATGATFFTGPGQLIRVAPNGTRRSSSATCRVRARFSLATMERSTSRIGHVHWGW